MTGAGVGQQVLGHSLELFGVAVDGVQHAHLALGELGMRVQQQLDETPDRRDRRSQLVETVATTSSFICVSSRSRLFC